MAGLRTGLCVLLAVTVASIAGLGGSWYDYASTYAPIIRFHDSVEYRPSRFPEDGRGPSCVYVNWRSPDTFQYWLYYEKDVRLPEPLRGVPLIEAWQDVMIWLIMLASVSPAEEALHAWIDFANKLLHWHDWELIEVRVAEWGERPTSVTYYAHGEALSLSRTEMVGYQPVAYVYTDMHGLYPPDRWVPEDAFAFNPGALLEGFLSGLMEGLGDDSYHTVDYSGRCRLVSDEMREIHSLFGYPYCMPWDREWSYSSDCQP